MTDGKPLANCSVLVLEDDFYLATDMAEVLEEAGARVMGPFANVGTALAALDEGDPDMAILDVNLGAQTSFEIGRSLRTRGVPLLFVTGYDRSIIPADLAETEYLIKPVDMGKLIAAVAKHRR